MINLDLTKKYALAVSGGVDSMAMLHMFANLSPRPNFFVVTINHNIRSEAQSDCEFVKNYCDKLNVKCKIFCVDVPSFAQKEKLSEETAARILRYQMFDSIECDYVCLAHHLRDNAETVLMHILRGSGASGATGISRQNGKYLRPILDMSREEIEQYALQNNVPSVHDRTNDEIKYTRNYIRQNVLPILQKLNPSAEQNIVRFAENIAVDNEFLNELADISEVQFIDGKALIPIRILNQPKPIAYRILNKVFKRLSVYKDIERTHLEALFNLSRANGGKSISLPFGYVATNDYEFITLELAQEHQNAEFEIPFKTGKTITPFGVVNVSKTYVNGAHKIDVNKIPHDAVFRTKTQGDYFEKFGGGSKPLKKYLIDKKILQRKRQELILLASANEVLAICGVEISDKVRVDETSNQYYIYLEKE